MEKNNKQLLIRDICARLPYGVYIKFKQYNEPLYLSVKDRLSIYNGGELINNLQYLYLRPMSNMTEEEYNKYELTFDNVVVYSGHNNNNIHSEHRPTYETFDYLDSIHVDYRDLIPKGLALVAPEGMYN